MAKNLILDEEVWIPRNRIGQDPGEHPVPFVRGKVIAVHNRTVDVEIPGEPTPLPVAASAVHRNIGILSVRIGDLSTESTLLDPLAKSVGQFCRLLLPDDYVRILALRTREELKVVWGLNHATTTLVLITGHGAPDAIVFGVGGSISAEDLTDDLQATAPQATSKVFLSLACQTGQAAFAKPFSKWAGCEAFLAPYHSVHGAIASQFVQTFLVYHLLEGETLKVAFNHARERVAGATSFRMWVQGKLLAGG